MRTDDELLAAFRAGDRAAFEALFERYRAPVWAFFRRRVADPAGAEDLAQDVFVAVLKAAGRYDARGTFRSYVFGIAFNILASSRRVSRRDAEPASSRIDSSRPASDPASVLWVRQALSELDEADREVLMLREFEELRYDEIAAVLGVPVNTVRSRLFRARAALRSQLTGGREAAGGQR